MKKIIVFVAIGLLLLIIIGCAVAFFIFDFDPFNLKKNKNNVDINTNQNITVNENVNSPEINNNSNILINANLNTNNNQNININYSNIDVEQITNNFSCSEYEFAYDEYDNKCKDFYKNKNIEQGKFILILKDSLNEGSTKEIYKSLENHCRIKNKEAMLTDKKILIDVKVGDELSGLCAFSEQAYIDNNIYENAIPVYSDKIETKYYRNTEKSLKIDNKCFYLVGSSKDCRYKTPYYSFDSTSVPFDEAFFDINFLSLMSLKFALQDADNDGLLNYVELIKHTDINSPTNKIMTLKDMSVKYQESDADFDGIEDIINETYSLVNGDKSDTDGDSYSDGEEIINGYNPNGAGKAVYEADTIAEWMNKQAEMQIVPADNSAL